MKKIYFFFFFLLFVHCLTFAQNKSQIVKYHNSDCIQSEVIVKFKKQNALHKVDYRGLKNDLIKTYSAEVKQSWEYGAELWKVDGDINQIIEELSKNDNIEYVEPNYVTNYLKVPDDSYFEDETYLNIIQAPQAWNITTGDSSIIVVINDSGVEYLHPDLRQNIWTNDNEIPDDGIDNDNNGYIDDYYGWNFTSNNNDVSEDFSSINHGTRVAGIVGAKGNNGIGITGILWNVKLMILPQQSNSATISGIEYAIEKNAKIFNCSWNVQAYSKALYDAMKWASNHNLLFICGAGNSGQSSDIDPVFPASFDLDNIISVGASNIVDDNLESYSTWGSTSVDLVAPGYAEWTTINNGYGSINGTSCSAPIVSGACALLWSLYPNYSYEQIKSQLLNTVDTFLWLEDKVVSSGRLNIYKLLSDNLYPLSYSESHVDFGYTTINQRTNRHSIKINNNLDIDVTVDSVVTTEGYFIEEGYLLVNKKNSIVVNSGGDISLDFVFQSSLNGNNGGYAIFYYFDKSDTVTFASTNVKTILTAQEYSESFIKENSPYLINGNVLISSNESVVINPGVKIYFAENSGIVIQDHNTISAIGTDVLPIEFLNAESNKECYGITIYSGTDTSIFSNCNFNLNTNSNFITISQSPVQIENCTFKGETSQTLITSSGDLRIQDCKIIDVNAGLNLINCSSTKIINTTIDNNFFPAMLGDGNYFIDECTITENNTNFGIFFFQSSSSELNLFNTLIAKNKNQQSYGAINVSNANKVNVINSTITNELRYGINVSNCNYLNILNSIIWNNQLGEINIADLDKIPNLNIASSLIKGGYEGINIYNFDPLFEDTQNYMLSVNSPCRNRGVKNGFYDNINGTTNDLGYTGGNGIYIENYIKEIYVTPQSSFSVNIFNCRDRAININNITSSSGKNYYEVTANQLILDKYSSTELIFNVPDNFDSSIIDTIYFASNDLPNSVGNLTLILKLTHGIPISGTLSGNLESGKEYFVSSDLIIPSDSIIVIEKGVKLNMNKNTNIIVEGNLIVNGEKGSEVIFSGIDDSLTWGYIDAKLINANFLKVVKCTQLYLYNAQLSNSIFIDNNSLSNPFITAEGDVKIINSKFENNKGAYVIRTANSSKLKFINNVLINNEGSGVVSGLLGVWYKADANIFNNTICYNNYDNVFDIRPFQGASRIKIANSIIYNNSNTSNPFNFVGTSSEGSLTINNSSIECEKEKIVPDDDQYQLLWNDTNLISENPQFSDSLGHLLFSSPCINAGTFDTTGLQLLSYDIDSNPRVIGNVDMGAYEFQGPFVIPIQLYPPNNSQNLDLNIIFKWYDVLNATKYNIKLSTDSLFSIDSILDSVITQTNISVAGLLSGQKYYWKIQAINSNGDNSLSDTWDFITAMYAPTNLSVQQNEANEITLIWDIESSNTEGHIIERKNNEQNTFSFLDSLKGNSNTYKDTTILINQTYSYRIKSYTKFVESDYSNIASIDVTGIEGFSFPTSYSLSQNYPNPFNPRTIINYTIPKTSFVTLKVYDILGREIISLVHEEKSLGNYNIIFDGTNLSSGIYFYRLQTDSFSDTKKFILLK